MSLTTLPTDLRVQIWRLLLTRPCPVSIDAEGGRVARGRLLHECRGFNGPGQLGCSTIGYNQRPWRPKTDTFDVRVWMCLGPAFTLAVLLVCRTIYVEASEVLYMENKFVLCAESPKDLPLYFDFSRIRFLLIDIRRKSKVFQNIHGFREMFSGLRLHPETRLSFVTASTEQPILEHLAITLESLGPVRSCSLAFGSYPHAKRVATKLLGDQDASRHIFPQYSKLPPELRCYILSFTALVQDYYIYQGRRIRESICCKKCSDIPLACCCFAFSSVAPPAWPRSNIEKPPVPIVEGSRFSQTCQCKYGIPSLLSVSSSFRQDALRVLFRQSSFTFGGDFGDHLLFMIRLQQNLKLVKRINLDLPYVHHNNWEDQEQGWNRLAKYIESHIPLQSLSLTILAKVRSSATRRLFTPFELETFQSYYRIFIPGAQRLAAGGLGDFSVEFEISELGSWKDSYEEEVMGERYVRKDSHEQEITRRRRIEASTSISVVALQF